jgi:hypothetical protein
MRFSLSIQDSATDTITPIMVAYNARTASGYIEGQECCIEKLQALGGTFSYLMPVDLFNDESVPLTRQLKDLQNLSTIWTDYTQDFQIPASETNNAIFANWFDENLVIGAWNPNIGKNATIFINGLPVFEGRVELIGCKFKDGLPQLYNIIFYGTTKKILDAWGETLMNEVDWSAYDHVANYANILSSWDQALLSGDILWTIADYNQGWRYSKMAGVNGNIRDSRGVEIDDLRPSIRLRAMLTTVFDSIGYTLSGAFLTRPEMDDLYILPMQTAGPLYDPEYTLPGTFEAYVAPKTFTGTIFASLSYKSLVFSSVVTNPSGNYNSTSGNYTANRGGQYRFVVTLNDLTAPGIPLQNLQFAFFVNGRKIYAPATGTFTTGFLPPPTVSFTFNQALSTGDVVSVKYVATGTWTTTSIQFECDIAPQGIKGNTIDMGDAMPQKPIKDFVNGVLQAYNCILIPTSDKTIEIHNLQDWYALGTTKNWTEYVDITDIQHDKIPIPRHVSFTHQESTCLANAYYKQINQREFGSIKFMPVIDYPTDEFNVESPFHVIAPQAMNEVNANGQIVRKTELNIPVFMDSDAKPVQQDYTLFYYGGKQSISDPYYFDNVNQYVLPLMTPYSDYPTLSTSYSNAFGLELSLRGDAPVNSMYQMYWSEYLSRMYSTQSRVVKMTAVLPVGEWLKLELNDTIAISSNYYKLQSVQYDMLTEIANLELVTYPDVEILSFTTTGQKPDFTNVTPTPFGESYLKDYSVAKGIMNSYKFNGQDYLDTNQDIDYNQNNVFSLVQQVNNVQSILQFNQITMYREVLSGPSTTDSTIWATVPMEEVETIGYVDNITYTLNPSKYVCTDGGQYKFTAMVEMEQSGNHHTTVAILVNGIQTTGYGAIASDYGIVNFSTILDLSPTDEVTLAWKPRTGGSHTVYFTSANFLVLKK